VLLGRLRIVPEGWILRLFFELVYELEFTGIVKDAPEAFAGDR
jgi:hypothetical protein